MKEINAIQFSMFPAPVSVTKPFKSVTIEEVHQMITGDSLKSITEKIRSGKADKGNVLPSVTFSAICSKRCKKGVLEYSTLMVFDVDKLDFASTLKWRISIDVFLKAVLVFISPGGKGVKFVVRIKDGKPEEHELYFKAVAHYMKGVFGIRVDESGKDISRLCFLCWDPAACYNPEGYVTAEALLRLLPKEESFRVSGVQSPRKVHVKDAMEDAKDAKPANCETDEICNRLNNLPAILYRAYAALRKAGWKHIRGTEYWSRPGGKPGKISAVFNRYEAENRYVFTNFSSNGLPFETRGYSPAGVICELEFGGDFEACIEALKAQLIIDN